MADFEHTTALPCAAKLLAYTQSVITALSGAANLACRFAAPDKAASRSGLNSTTQKYWSLCFLSQQTKLKVAKQIFYQNNRHWQRHLQNST